MPAAAEIAFAYEFLLTAVKAFVPFSVVLTGEGFAAHGADEGALVGVGAKMGAQVVGPREAFGAEGALECGGMFLDALLFAGGGWASRVCKFEYVISVGNGRG